MSVENCGSVCNEVSVPEKDQVIGGLNKLSHIGRHHMYFLSTIMGKIKSNMVGWIGHAARVKVKIIHKLVVKH